MSVSYLLGPMALGLRALCLVLRFTLTFHCLAVAIDSDEGKIIVTYYAQSDATSANYSNINTQ